MEKSELQSLIESAEMSVRQLRDLLFIFGEHQHANSNPTQANAIFGLYDYADSITSTLSKAVTVICEREKAAQ